MHSNPKAYPTGFKFCGDQCDEKGALYEFLFVKGGYKLLQEARVYVGDIREAKEKANSIYHRVTTRTTNPEQ